MPKGSGRRPKPTKLRKLQGNAGKRKINLQEPVAPAGEPQMPDELSQAAAAEWKRIVPELKTMGILSVVDGKALAAYCHAYARWAQAEVDVAKYGLTIEEPVIDTVTGKQRRLRGRYVVRLKKNPAINVAHEAMKLMKSFLVEFGMTPASRSRIRAEKPVAPDLDPGEAFFGLNEKSSLRPN